MRATWNHTGSCGRVIKLRTNSANDPGCGIEHVKRRSSLCASRVRA
jgi:hypothetical protein